MQVTCKPWPRARLHSQERLTQALGRFSSRPIAPPISSAKSTRTLHADFRKESRHSLPDPDRGIAVTY
eukprot:scaffold244341_cov22-Tisochrysis_lutea.AAC.1